MKIEMNKDILNIINTVLDYKRFLIGYHLHILKEKDYDFIEETEKFYYSLPLPRGLEKNKQDFESILSCSNGSYLDELNSVEEKILCNYNWRNY